MKKKNTSRRSDFKFRFEVKQTIIVIVLWGHQPTHVCDTNKSLAEEEALLIT